MSTAEPEPIESDEYDSIREAADIWADEYGTEEAIQRLWKAVAYLKRREAREGANE